MGSDLINYLEQIFPNTLPPEGSPYSALERAWGRQEVVEHLRRVKEQNEEDNNVLRLQQTSTGSNSGSTSAASG